MYYAPWRIQELYILIMKQFEQKMNKKISPFVTKLISILENEKNHKCISWVSQGTFMITDSDELSHNVLSKHFKHSNFSSFIRQLNIYGFEKVRSQQNCHYYHHKSFIPNNKKQLKQIQRKLRKIQNSNSNKNIEVEQSLSNDKMNIQIQFAIDELKKQNEKIKDQNKKLNQKIQTIAIENKNEVQKILAFLNQLNKRYSQKIDNQEESDNENRLIYMNISAVLTKQIQNVEKLKSSSKKIDFESIFALITSIIQTLQLKQKSCATNMEDQYQKGKKQTQNLPVPPYQSEQNCIFVEDQANFNNESQGLNIDNIF